VQPGDGRDRHAGLGCLLNQPDLLRGTVAPATFASGDDFNALNRIGHRRMPRLAPGPLGYATCPVELGGAPRSRERAMTKQSDTVDYDGASGGWGSLRGIPRPQPENGPRPEC
jgi:hypothetical protein